MTKRQKCKRALNMADNIRQQMRARVQMKQLIEETTREELLGVSWGDFYAF